MLRIRSRMSAGGMVESLKKPFGNVFRSSAAWGSSGMVPSAGPGPDGASRCVLVCCKRKAYAHKSCRSPWTPLYRNLKSTGELANLRIVLTSCHNCISSAKCFSAEPSRSSGQVVPACVHVQVRMLCRIVLTLKLSDI